MKNYKIKKPNIVLLLCLFFFITVIYALAFLQEYKLKLNGVYTITKYYKTEYEGDGSNNYVDIFFNKKKYKKMLSTVRGAIVGKYYFILINKDKPSGYSSITTNEVPQCIIDSIEYKLPPEGWKEIPKDVCK